MLRAPVDPDAWKRIVLKAMSPPEWLAREGTHREVVLSTRVRYMRNLRGHRFAHLADSAELREIERQCTGAISRMGGLEIQRNASPAERDYLVACRLVSPDFPWTKSGRALALDARRTVSIMVGEEDHLRIQALSPGWSLDQAAAAAESALSGLSKELDFARSPKYGYLSASAPNCGPGIRQSAMFHLIGLAHSKRLATVIRALNSQGLVVRGLFGERSRAIGAFVQVSTTGSSLPQFVGACDYLLKEERNARAGIAGPVPQTKIEETREVIAGARQASLADALRILAWLRWCAAIEPNASSLRTVDALIPEIALLESLGDERAGRARVDLLKRVLSV